MCRQQTHEELETHSEHTPQCKHHHSYICHQTVAAPEIKCLCAIRDQWLFVWASSNSGHISGSVSQFAIKPTISSCPPLCVCVWDSRFHVVSLQDGLDGQVAHAWVFGKVALGPELVLQHLGKVPDILPWCSLKRGEGTKVALFTPWEWGANTHIHTHTHLSLHTAHLFLALLRLFTHLVSEVNALFVGSECVITVTRERNRFMTLSQEPQSLYFRPGPVLQKSQFNPLFTLHVLNICIWLQLLVYRHTNWHVVLLMWFGYEFISCLLLRFPLWPCCKIHRLFHDCAIMSEIMYDPKSVIPSPVLVGFALQRKKKIKYFNK